MSPPSAERLPRLALASGGCCDDLPYGVQGRIPGFREMHLRHREHYPAVGRILPGSGSHLCGRPTAGETFSGTGETGKVILEGSPTGQETPGRILQAVLMYLLGIS